MFNHNLFLEDRNYVTHSKSYTIAIYQYTPTFAEENKAIINMKSKMVLIGLAMVATTVFSCKRDYTCSCSKIYTASTGTITYNDGSYVLKDNEVRASDQCNKQERTGSDLDGDYSKQYEIK